MADLEVSVDQEIGTISMKAPHVIILGAGASKAAFPTGDFNSKKIPLMNDLIEAVGLEDLLKRSGVEYKEKDFEGLFSSLVADEKYSGLCKQIESKIYDYFSTLEYPYKPTIYDHLVLSLRETDLIATFNWDPFLMEAYRRNKRRFRLPAIVHLHGNVTVGYCLRDKVQGLNNNKCSKCNKKFTPSPLLYPITKKDYNSNEFVKNEWNRLSKYLEHAFMITIFGYRAPQSDIEAMEILKKAWGEVEKRSMEQVEVIVRPGTNEETVWDTWDGFIHSHHYDIIDNFYNSWIANHPRRTGEAYINQYINAKFINKNPIPQDFSYMELWNWLKPLATVEEMNRVKD